MLIFAYFYAYFSKKKIVTRPTYLDLRQIFFWKKYLRNLSFSWESPLGVCFFTGKYSISAPQHIRISTKNNNIGTALIKSRSTASTRWLDTQTNWLIMTLLQLWEWWPPGVTDGQTDRCYQVHYLPASRSIIMTTPSWWLHGYESDLAN